LKKNVVESQVAPSIACWPLHGSANFLESHTYLRKTRNSPPFMEGS